MAQRYIDDYFIKRKIKLESFSVPKSAQQYGGQKNLEKKAMAIGKVGNIPIRKF
ncbi:MAG TPA: hypothetical protein VJC12_03410 [Candidatus Paceibacterota bacterium]